MPEQKESDKRFEISIPFSIEEIKDGQPTPFFDCNLTYHDIAYDGVVAIQSAMIELLERLNEYGFATAETMGLGKKLEVLGLKKK